MRESLRHNHAIGGIDRQMLFAPFPARFRAMLRLQPLVRSVDPQAGTVDRHVQLTLA